MAKTVNPDDQARLYSVTVNKDGLGNNLVIRPIASSCSRPFLQHPDVMSLPPRR
jgi:hypothetical protein